jgi:hypothetical protein
MVFEQKIGIILAAVAWQTVVTAHVPTSLGRTLFSGLEVYNKLRTHLLQGMVFERLV